MMTLWLPSGVRLPYEIVRDGLLAHLSDSNLTLAYLRGCTVVDDCLSSFAAAGFLPYLERAIVGLLGVCWLAFRDQALSLSLSLSLSPMPMTESEIVGALT